jgi:hypothetical protein
VAALQARPEATVSYAQSGTGIHIKASALWVWIIHTSLGLWKPIFYVDGQRQKGQWGDNFVPVSPGQHELKATIWILFYAWPLKAKMNVTVAEGAPTEVSYHLGVLTLGGGNLRSGQPAVN